MTVLREARIEWKAVLNRNMRMDSLRMMLLRLGYSEQFAPRTVSSLYYDTPQLASAQESSAGERSRVKVRLRWYGTRDDVRANLEKKMRDGHKVSKWVTDTDIVAASAPQELWCLPAKVIQDAEFDLRLLSRRRILRVSYERAYFWHPLSKTRATIDMRLRWCLAACQPIDRHGRWQFSDYSVLEFKRADGISSYNPCQDVGLRSRRYSKYVSGLESFGLMHLD